MKDLLLFTWDQAPMWYQTFFPKYDTREEFFKEQEVVAILIVRNPDWNQMATKRMLAIFSSDPTFEVTGSLDQVPLKAFFWVRDKP